jgi:hypothetical protein
MNLLTATPDEAALIIACALTDAMDLLRLARACRRFATKCIAAPAAHRNATSGGGTAAAAQQLWMWSIAEEVARRWITDCTDQERGWVPRRGRESWLGLMWEVQSLRRAAVFGRRSHEWITLFEGGSRATVHADGAPTGCTSAASKAVMRAGRHYVQFTVVSGSIMFFGVIRPGWGVEGGTNAPWVDGHCFFYTGDGSRFPGGQDWEGMQHAGRGNRIGLLLDLDQGTMTVFKNDERLGVMATGLSGEYCWAVSLYTQGDEAAPSPASSMRIEAAPPPASPTVQELARAVAHEVEQPAVDDDY